MINIVKVISTSFNNVKNRLVKFTRMGKFDTQDTKEYGPYGFDSNPIVGMRAIYADTGNIGKPVIIGYLNLNQLADVGEARMYSTDADGGLKFWVWCKKDGTLELGGNTKHLARYEELKAGFDQLKSDHNALVNAFNTHMHATAGSGPPSIPTPGSDIPATASTASIDTSKIDEIKTL